MKIKLYFPTFLMSWLLLNSLGNAKTYEASDSDQVSLSALSLVKQNDWAALRLSVESKEDVDKFVAKLKNKNILSPDFEAVKAILENEENGIEFISYAFFSQKYTRIRFSLNLETRKDRPIISISNLDVFENTDGEWKKKAFVYMDPHQHPIVAGIEKSYCTQRSSLIYPIFESEERDGKLNVDGDISLDGNSMYVDLFKLALALHRHAAVR